MIRRYSNANRLIHRRFIIDGNNVKSVTSGSNLRCSNNFSSSSTPKIDDGSAVAKSSITTAANNNNSNDATNSKLLDQWLEAWNEHSGTHEITKLKQLVHTSSLQFDTQQRLVSTARKAVDDALSTWEQSQLQHAQLLQVRERWTPAQALEFAKLLEREVQVRSELEQAKKDLAEKEVHLSKLQMDYMNNLRKRYHEEQIWTDRWRILSTYGTWGLIALNSVVFLISQYLFKLRERSRMKDFELLLKETLSSNNSTMLAIREHQNDIIVEQQQQHQQQQQQSESEGKSSVTNEEGQGQVDEQSSIDVEKEEGEKKMLSSDDKKEESNSEHDALNTEQKSADNNDDDEPKLLESNESKSEPPSLNMQQPVLLTNIKSKLANLDRDEKLATAIQQASQSLVLGWTKLQTRVSEKKVEYVDKIDLPSAALGACVASMAWLVAMSLPRKGG